MTESEMSKIVELMTAAASAAAERNALRLEVERLHAQNIELTRALAVRSTQSFPTSRMLAT